MKNLFLAFLLLPSFLLAQDSFDWNEKPQQPEPQQPRPEIQPQERVYQFDKRCYNQLSYAFNMIRVRRSGITKEEVRAKMALEYETGALREVPIAILTQMVNIVTLVFAFESVETETDVVNIMLLIEKNCQALILKHEIEAKKREEVHT